MSRIGKLPISIPEKVKITYKDSFLKVDGPKGSLKRKIVVGIDLLVEKDKILLKRLNDDRKTRALHGLMRTLVSNMIIGVTHGFKKILEINGLGYRAEQAPGNQLKLDLGYSHPIIFPLPEGITAKVEKQTTIMVEGIDKEIVGLAAAKIRDFRKPEPYKGKGIRYQNEHIRRKVGKSGVK